MYSYEAEGGPMAVANVFILKCNAGDLRSYLHGSLLNSPTLLGISE